MINCDMKIKLIELASLRDILSKCGGGRRCAKHKPKGRERSAPSVTSHEERTSGSCADKVVWFSCPEIICYMLDINA